MTNKFIKLQKDELKRIKFLKKELIVIILKSILNNQQLEPQYRV